MNATFPLEIPELNDLQLHPHDICLMGPTFGHTVYCTLGGIKLYLEGMYNCVVYILPLFT